MPERDESAVRLALAWYFHLPSLASTIEVRDHAYRSLALLLRIHRVREVPVLVAPTGAFLTLCRRDAPDVLDDLGDAFASRVAAPATTCFYDIDPFSISWLHLEEQLRRDHSFKEELFGRQPAWFFPPSFAWHPACDTLLARLGIAGTVLDSRHLAFAATARAWRWSTDPLGTVSAIDTQPFVAPWEHRRLRTLPVGEGRSLRLVFRDWQLTRALTFGNEAEIHKSERDIPGKFDGCGDRDLVVLADDGDRIGPTSRRGYEELLDLAQGTVCWSELARERSPLPPLRELPAFSQPGIDELIRSSLEARAYWSLLAQIADAPLDSAQLARLLELQDVFYPFWKGCGRRRWYLDAAVELLEETREAGRSQARPALPGV